MTAAELIARAAACQDCGKEHKARKVAEGRWSWADPNDGHWYRPVLYSHVLARLRELAAP